MQMPFKYYLSFCIYHLSLSSPIPVKASQTKPGGLTGVSPTMLMVFSLTNITVTARQSPALSFPTVIDALRKNRIALAPAFAHYPPMLARVLSAALSRHNLPWETTAEVNGIEAFPVEVEVNCGWGDKVISNVILRFPNEVILAAVCIAMAVAPRQE